MALDLTMRQRKIIERDHPSQIMSITAHIPDENVFYHEEDTALSFMFLCDPIAGISEGMIQQLQVITSFDYPENTLMQVGLWTSPDLEMRLLIMQRMREQAGKIYPSRAQKIAATISNKREEFLRQHTLKPLAGDAETRLRDLRVFVTCKVPFAGVPDDESKSIVNRLKIQVRQTLSTLGMNPIDVDPEIYLRFLGSMVNWSDNASWRSRLRIYDDNEPIRDQVIDRETEITVGSDKLGVGKKYVKSLSVKKYPEYIHLSDAMNYLGDIKSGQRGVRQNLLITLNIVMASPEKMKTTLGTEKNHATWQAMGNLARYMPSLKAKKESYDSLSNALEDGDRPLYAYLGFVIFEDNEEKLISATSNLVTYYRGMGFGLQEDMYINLPMFFNALPLCADLQAQKHLMRYKRMAGRHAVNLMPVIGDWKGTQHPVITLHSRNGQLVTYDQFDSNTNYSAVCAASSGSGKSYFINDLMHEYLSIGAQIFVIDVGKSFKNSTKVLHGDHMQFTPDSDISLNPFTNIERYEEQADFLQAVLLAMISPKGDISEFQIAMLNTILSEQWKIHGKDLSIDKLASVLLDFKNQDGSIDTRVTDMGVQLHAFTTNGQYGKWFNKPANIDFKNSLTVCELLELKERKHLQRVVLVQLIAAIQRAMFEGDDTRLKLLILDEAFDLITEGPEGKFIERGVRQLRKHRGGAIIILQSINDLYKTTTGEAIAENTATKYYLGQESEAIDRLVESKKLSMNPGVVELLRTVRTQKGEFSEIFISTKNGWGIGRLAVDSYSNLMFSTDSKEKALLGQKIDQGMQVEDAIEAVLNDKADKENRQAS